MKENEVIVRIGDDYEHDYYYMTQQELKAIQWLIKRYDIEITVEEVTENNIQKLDL